MAFRGAILMIRITFLVGNGFDLNIGLDTTYENFYKYYVGRHPNDLLAQAIDDNYLYWADLEMGLGRYTECILADEEDSFWESEEVLEQELVVYLKAQMERVNISDDERKTEVALEMQRSLTRFYEELPRPLKGRIYDVLDGVRENIVYSFISFNYTDVLDQCLNITRKIIPNDFGKHSCNGGLIYSDTVGEALHIHGTTNGDMVLGVNDESQIANKEFCKNNLYKQLLIKEEINKYYDYDKVEQTYKIIDESIIICVYGMSIGQTDRKWWEYICRCLQNNSEKILIIYTKTQKNADFGKYTLFKQRYEMLNRLKNNANVSNEIWDQIKDQIYVKCNSKIFNFSIVDR